MAKNSKKYYGYINPSRAHPVDLIAIIQSVVKVLRGTVASVELTDVTRYGDRTPDTKTWSLIDSATGQNIIESVEQTSNFSNITLDSFSVQVQDGNVIGFTAQTQDGSVDALDQPFDVDETQLENKPVGENQQYQFVVDLEPMPIKVVDDKSVLLPHQLVKIADTLESLLIMEDVSVTFNGVRDTDSQFSIVNQGQPDEYYYAEFGTAANFDVDVNNIFSGGVTTLKVLNDANELVNVTVNPDNGDYFGDKLNALPDNFSVGSSFEYGGGANVIEVLSVKASDGTTEDTKQVDIRIDYPLNAIIETTSITGEPDSNQTPTGSATETNVAYDFKNYLYIKTDRTDLSTSNLEARWKKDDGVDTFGSKTLSITILTDAITDVNGTYDIISVPIPVYGEPFVVDLFDNDFSADSRDLTADVSWINYTPNYTETFSDISFVVSIGDSNLVTKETFTDIDFKISIGSEDLQINENFNTLSFS